MVINTFAPQMPTLNSDIIRPQKSPDSSPESTVIQDRNVAPIPDPRVVQQADESSSGHLLQNPWYNNQQSGVAQQLPAESARSTHEPSLKGANPALNDAGVREVQQLAQRDQEVRAHEQAHLSAAGSRATSGASFTYTEGPDGKRYATGGEVSVNTSPVQGDPEATLRVAELIQRAALAPAEPSAQDRQVAVAAGAMAQVASAEINQQRVDEMQAMNAVAGGSSLSPAVATGQPEAASAAAVVNVNTVIDGSERSPAEVPVERRDVQVQQRQQLLESAYGAVAKVTEEGLRGGSSDRAQPVASANNPAPAAVASAGPEENQVADGVRSNEQAAAVEVVSQDESEALYSPVQITPLSVAVDEVSVAAEEAVRETSSDTREQQVKERQQLMEGIYSEVTQGLGGEPRGTNLDYFL